MLHIPENDFALASSRAGLESDVRSEPSKISMLDSLVSDPIDFIKIDVEGSEPDVWSGMQGIIDRSPNLQVLLEYTPGFFDSPETGNEWLMKLNEDWTFFLVETNGELVKKDVVDVIHDRAVENGYEMIWMRR